MSRIALIGSRDLRGEWGKVAIAAILSTFDSDSTLLVRTSSGGVTASPVEQVAVEMAEAKGIPIERFASTEGGRAATYHRDYRLVEQSDRIVAFFLRGQEMEGGTGHVVEAAIKKGATVEAWALGDDGEVTAIGSIASHWLEPWA
jgi:hypothetical protein